MGNRGIGISTYAIILISITCLFFPSQQVNGIFSLELSEEELIMLNELEQLAKSEQLRNEIFIFQKLENPYLNTNSDVIITFKVDYENGMPKVIQRHHEIFQTIKDEQISLAEKKCKEILGGKNILNSINSEPIYKKTAHEFKIDNQTGFIARNGEGFQDYRLLQISIAKDFRDNNWHEFSFDTNPYLDNESIEISFTNKENKILEDVLNYRLSEEFKNLIIEQIFQAEKIRNEMLSFEITKLPNPYLNEDMDEGLDENVDEGLEESSIKSNSGIVIDWSDPTYVTDKPEYNIIDRHVKGFEMVKAMELKIAQNTLNEMLMLLNSEKDDVEIIILTNENKKINNYERDDKGFEFFKNKQIERAEKKLMEILGQKDIHNSDYLEFEKTKIKYYSNLN